MVVLLLPADPFSPHLSLVVSICRSRFSVFWCLHLANDYELIFDCTIGPFMHAYIWWYEYHLLLRIEIATENCTVTARATATDQHFVSSYDHQLWSWYMIVCYFVVISTRAPAVYRNMHIFDLYTCVVRHMIFDPLSMIFAWSMIWWSFHVHVSMQIFG